MKNTKIRRRNDFSDIQRSLAEGQSLSQRLAIHFDIQIDLSRLASMLPIHLIGKTLFWGLALIYFLWPSAFPFHLGGIPLNSRTELLGIAVTFFVLLVHIVIALIRRAKILPLSRVSASDIRRRFLIRALATLCLVSLIGIKWANPMEQLLRTCFRSPLLQEKGCQWNPEKAPYQSSPFSRLDSVWNYHSKANPWNLQFFNDVDHFNAYANQPPKSKLANIWNRRIEGNFPFSAELSLSPKAAEFLNSPVYLKQDTLKLEITLRGGLSKPQEVAFSENRRSVVVDVPAAQLQTFSIRYQNYYCPRGESCKTRLNLHSIAADEAILSVKYLNPESHQYQILSFRELTKENLFRTRALLLLEAFMILLLIVLALPSELWHLSIRRIRLRIQWRDFLFVVGLVALGYLVIESLPKSFFHHPYLDNGVKLSRLLRVSLIPIAILMMMFLRSSWRRWGANLYRESPFFGTFIMMGPILFYCLWVMGTQFPALDRMIWFEGGNDPLMYSTQAKSILRTGDISQPFHGPLFYSSKPLFLHFRALTYLLLGDGDKYYSALVSFFFVLGWAILINLLALSWCLSRNTIRIRSWTIPIGGGLAFSLLILFYRNYFDFSAWMGSSGNAEGPAWWLATLAATWLIPLSIAPKKGVLQKTVVFSFCAALLFRSQYILLGPFLIYLTHYYSNQENGKSLLKYTSLGLAITALIIFANLFQYLPSLEDMKFYFSVASPYKTGNEPLTLLAERLPMLIPSVYEGFVVALFLFLILGQSIHRKQITSGMGLLAIMAISGFAFQLLFVGNSGGYPRHLMQTFFIIYMGSFPALLALMRQGTRTTINIGLSKTESFPPTQKCRN